MAQPAYSRKAQRPNNPLDPKGQPFYAKGGPTLLSMADPDPKDQEPTRQEQQDWATIYEHYESRRQALYTWRLPWWTTWSQIARYIRPDRYYYFIVSNVLDKGLRRDQAIVDRTATLAGEGCAAGLMAGLTDPDRDWAKFGPAIPGFELDQAAQAWYEDIGERYNYVLTHCNFYDAQAQHYQDLVDFGNAPIIDYEDEEEVLHCFTPCAGEYMLGAGFDFSDEVLYREFRLTVSQMVEMFGVDALPADIQQMWRQKGGALEYEQVIGHAIEPNFAINDGRDGNVGVVPGGFTWREVYWIRGKKDAKPLAMAGFHQQPFAVSRWNTQGNDAYGRGVGEYMLPDAISLQLATRQMAESIEKVNRPPMGADVSLQNLPASTNPGKITFFNTGNGGEKKFFPLYEVKPDIPAIAKYIEQVQARIQRTAYNEVFQIIQNLRQETKAEITATEVDALREEALLRMGPVIGRVYSSLRKRVRRHLAIMERKGLIPPKPPSLQGVPTKIDFISMLTAAQKATSTAAIARSVQFAGAISGAYPEAKFAIDPIAAIREFNEGVGSTSKILRSPQQVKQLQQAFAQQQQAAAAMQQTVEGSQAAAALGKTSLAPDTTLSALVGRPGG